MDGSSKYEYAIESAGSSLIEDDVQLGEDLSHKKTKLGKDLRCVYIGVGVKGLIVGLIIATAHVLLGLYC